MQCNSQSQSLHFHLVCPLPTLYPASCPYIRWVQFPLHNLRFYPACPQPTSHSVNCQYILSMLCLFELMNFFFQHHDYEEKAAQEKRTYVLNSIYLFYALILILCWWGRACMLWSSMLVFFRELWCFLFLLWSFFFCYLIFFDSVLHSTTMVGCLFIWVLAM